jgi:hypothetical protein
MSVIMTAIFLTGPTPAPAAYAWMSARIEVDQAPSVLSTNPFAPPVQFQAQRAIALHDTDGDGLIDTGTGSDWESFPLVARAPGGALGRHIGSPYVINDTGNTQGGFCGHLLVHGEQYFETRDRNEVQVYFVWVAFRDASREVPSECNDALMDAGVGSYIQRGNDMVLTGSRHATFFGGRAFNTSHSAFAFVYTTNPGGPASPGRIMTRDPEDRYAAYPAAIGNIVAFEPSGSLDDIRVTLSDIVLDVPLINEASWDGNSMFVTDQYARRIQGLAGGGETRPAVPESSSVGRSISQTLALDLNGDGMTDLLHSAGDRDHVSTAISAGDGSLIAQSAWVGVDHLNAAHAYSRLAGDFNGDARSDIILWRRGERWMHTFFSQANGEFRYHAHSPWHNKINDPEVGKIVGDFDGNGCSDILMWRQGWRSSPVSLFDSVGQFRTHNRDHSQGTNWINDPHAKKLVGDFNGDGKTDVALWRSGWGSTPVYFAAGDSRGRFTRFNVTNTAHAAPHNWINDPATTKFVGDFDGDGLSDIALSRPGWSSIPIYHSNGDGSFRVTNRHVSWSSSIMHHPDTRVLPGDYDGDGCIDLALTRPGWSSLPIYFSNADGGFTLSNRALPIDGSAVLDPRREVLTGDVNGDGRTDLLVPSHGLTFLFRALRGAFELADM